MTIPEPTLVERLRATECLIDEQAADEIERLNRLLMGVQRPEDVARDAAFERLRTAYQEMEAMCASYQAVAKIDLATLDADRRELALWAACEAGRWLDARAGGGPSDSFGRRLEKIAAVLALPHTWQPQEGWRKLSREDWARIVCEWDEANKGQCRCAKNGPAIEYYCSGCVGVADTVIATLSAPPPPVAESGWQREVLEWAVDKFGEIARDPRERAMRFVEEAVELAQTQGVTDIDLGRICRRVFTRPAGDAAKEIGQVGMTFEAMAENIGLKVAPLIKAEIERVKTIPKEEWQRRHAAKVAVGAALPAPPHIADAPSPFPTDWTGRDNSPVIADERQP